MASRSAVVDELDVEQLTEQAFQRVGHRADLTHLRLLASGG